MTVDEAITKQVERLLEAAKKGIPEDRVITIVIQGIHLFGGPFDQKKHERELVAHIAAYRLAQRVAELEPSPQQSTPL